jgi:chaperonin cofactor prefoldin
MLDKLLNFKKDVALALAEYPELTEEINDIHDYCMLFMTDGLAVFSNELDIAINDLEELIERNQKITTYTDWSSEWETEFERDL